MGVWVGRGYVVWRVGGVVGISEWAARWGCMGGLGYSFGGAECLVMCFLCFGDSLAMFRRCLGDVLRWWQTLNVFDVVADHVYI